ncbi:hypothetical protein ACTA71_003719 [Dictyostelium dimigraforme]
MFQMLLKKNRIWSNSSFNVLISFETYHRADLLTNLQESLSCRIGRGTKQISFDGFISNIPYSVQEYILPQGLTNFFYYSPTPASDHFTLPSICYNPLPIESSKLSKTSNVIFVTSTTTTTTTNTCVTVPIIFNHRYNSTTISATTQHIIQEINKATSTGTITNIH